MRMSPLSPHPGGEEDKLCVYYNTLRFKLNVLEPYKAYSRFNAPLEGLGCPGGTLLMSVIHLEFGLTLQRGGKRRH